MTKTQERIVNGYRVVTTWHDSRLEAERCMAAAKKAGAEDALVLRGSSLGAFRTVSWTRI